MPSPATMLLFAGAAMALLVIPGPAVLYVVSRSVDQGRRAGLLSVLGIHTGSIVHVVAATAGVSALIVRSAAAFTALKLAGAAYLIVLGVLRLVRRAHPDEATTPTPRSLRRVYWDGVVVNVLNPKTAVFFLAFLPQFVDPDRGWVAPQILVLGLTFMALGMLTDGTYALLAGTIGKRLHRSPRFVAVRERVSGAIFVVLGLATAAVARPAAASTK